MVALAQAAYAAVQQQGEQTFMRMGGIGVDGTIFWHDRQPERPRIRYVTITEREDLKQRASVMISISAGAIVTVRQFGRDRLGGPQARSGWPL